MCAILFCCAFNFEMKPQLRVDFPLKKMSFRDCHLKLNIFCLLRRWILITELIDHFFLFSKEYTIELTAPHLMTGMKDTRSKIVATYFCFWLTLKTEAAVSKLVELDLTLPWPGSPFSLDSWGYCITSFKQPEKNKQTNKQTIKNRHH